MAVKSASMSLEARLLDGQEPHTATLRIPRCSILCRVEGVGGMSHLCALISFLLQFSTFLFKKLSWSPLYLLSGQYIYI